jgi:signal transduction histidine kinase
MVDGVLDVGSAEARRRPATREAVDVAALVEGVAIDMRGRLPATVELLVETPEATKPVATDPALLRQVVLNLVSNALKFTESGSIRVQVVTDSASGPRRIAVHDTGIGIPAEKLKVIFEPFEQGDGSIHRRFGGAGLGLTISRDLCQVMGHRLEVDSKPGVGSTFSVVFGAESLQSPIERT